MLRFGRDARNTIAEKILRNRAFRKLSETALFLPFLFALNGIETDEPAADLLAVPQIQMLSEAWSQIKATKCGGPHRIVPVVDAINGAEIVSGF